MIGKLASGAASVTRFSAENAVSVGNAASLDASISKHDQLAVGASLGPKVEPRRSRAQRGLSGRAIRIRPRLAPTAMAAV